MTDPNSDENDSNGITDSNQPGATAANNGTVAALSYLLGAISGVIVWFLRRDSPFARFHAIQSILFTLSIILLVGVLSFVQFLLVFVPEIGTLLSILFSFVYIVIAVVVLVVWIQLMYQARQSVYYRLPFVGRLADRWTGTA